MIDEDELESKPEAECEPDGGCQCWEGYDG